MAKHKYIESPDVMWELFEAYMKEVKKNPRYKVQFVGKDGNQVYEPLERPLTMEGFENHCFKIGKISDLAHYFSNRGDAYNDYVPICSRIKKTIRQDQIEGGMVGQYNPSITQRLNGLTEKTESTLNTSINILNIDPLDDSKDHLINQNSISKKED